MKYEYPSGFLGSSVNGVCFHVSVGGYKLFQRLGFANLGGLACAVGCPGVPAAAVLRGRVRAHPAKQRSTVSANYLDDIKSDL